MNVRLCAAVATTFCDGIYILQPSHYAKVHILNVLFPLHTRFPHLCFPVRIACRPVHHLAMGLFVHGCVTISILLSTAVAHPGHNLHHGTDHSHQARQDGPAPFAGIEMPSTPGGSDADAPILTTVTRTSRLTSQLPNSKPTGPVTYITIGTTPIGPVPLTVVPWQLQLYAPLVLVRASTYQTPLLHCLPLLRMPKLPNCSRLKREGRCD